MNSLSKLLSDDAGNPSTMRALVSLIVIVQMAGWAWVCFTSGALPPMQWENVAMVVGALAAKSHQKQSEEPGA